MYAGHRAACHLPMMFVDKTKVAVCQVQIFKNLFKDQSINDEPLLYVVGLTVCDVFYPRVTTGIDFSIYFFLLITLIHFLSTESRARGTWPRASWPPSSSARCSPASALSPRSGLETSAPSPSRPCSRGPRTGRPPQK